MIFLRAIAAGPSFLFCAVLGVACGDVLGVILPTLFGPGILNRGEDTIWTPPFWSGVGAGIGALSGVLAAHAVWLLLGRAPTRAATARFDGRRSVPYGYAYQTAVVTGEKDEILRRMGVFLLPSWTWTMAGALLGALIGALAAFQVWSLWRRCPREGRD